MVSTAATFCCLVVRCSSTSSSCFLFRSEAPAAFQGAFGSAVPCNVLNEKHSNVLCPGRLHHQQSSRFPKYASCSFCRTPLRASSWETQWSFPPHHSRVFAERCSGTFLLGSSFFPSSIHLSSFFLSSLEVGPPFDTSLAALSAFSFSTWIPARYRIISDKSPLFQTGLARCNAR